MGFSGDGEVGLDSTRWPSEVFAAELMFCAIMLTTIVGGEMGLDGDSALISIWATFMGVEPKGLGLLSYGGASIMEEGENEENVSFRGCPLITNMVWEGVKGLEENRIHFYN